jgi:hypothetical protein
MCCEESEPKEELHMSDERDSHRPPDEQDSHRPPDEPDFEGHIHRPPGD